MEVEGRLRSALADRYELQDEVGHGGMGVVYRARDLRHSRAVALKVLRPEIASAVGPERFEREIQIEAQLQHPHIVPLFDSGTADGLPYFVMPFVEGESLAARMRREGQLPLDEALRIVDQVADALGYAHAQGVVHRDIKPENILLSGDHALVADFGIARVIYEGGQPYFTATNTALGTPPYMSPEQATASAHLDGRSDLYSLACVLFEMLAGEPPFSGHSAQAVIAKHLLETPPSVEVVRPSVPPAVSAAIRRGMAKQAVDRFATAAEFRAALHAEQPARVPHPPRRTRQLRATGLVIAVLVAAAGAWRVIWGPAFTLGDRNWVLVADFVGPADDPTLAAAVRSLALADLNQSRLVSVVPDELVRNAMRDAGIPETTQVDARLGAELAFRTSVRVVLVGRVDRLGGNNYSVVMHVIDVDDGANVLSEAASATDEGDALVRAVETVIRRVRVGLGERRDAVEANRPLMRVRTPDLAALRKFSDGIDAMRNGNYVASTALLWQAVERDTGFAAAWAVMAMNYMTSRQPDSAQVAFARAGALRERLSDEEWYRLRGDMAYNLDDDLPAAIRWYDLYLQERPQSVPARTNRALYVSSLGMHAEARRELELAVTIDPLHKGPRQIQLLNLAAELVVVGALDSARATAGRLSGAPRVYMDLLLLVAEDQWPEAAERAAAVARDPSTERFVVIPATTTWASGEAAQGRVGRALEILTTAANGSRGGAARWYARARMFLEAAAGWVITPLPDAIARDTTPGGKLLQGLVSAAAGDTATARARLAAVGELTERSRRRLGYGPVVLGAMIDARAGRWRAVVDSLGPAAKAGEHDPFSLDRLESIPIQWLVGHAYAGLGQLDSAVVLLEAVIAPTRMPPGHYGLRGLAYPFALRQLAVWNLELGRTDQAREAWVRFTDVFGSPEPALRSLRVAPEGL
jgi:serine/threonine-protein kinase